MLDIELPRDSQAPGLARRALASWYGAGVPKGELDAAKLVVSELVTNAVLHGVGRIQLRADLDEDRLLVEVLDDGHGFEHTLREVSFDELHKRGLVIVDALSSRWGIHEGTTHVWAELERPGPRLGEHKKPSM